MMILQRSYTVSGAFLENKYDRKYLLIGDFLPVAENSEIKLAKIYTYAGVGYINEKGVEIVKPIYYKISNFEKGIAKAVRLIDVPEFKGQKRSVEVILNYLGKEFDGGEDFKIVYKDGKFAKDYNIVSLGSLIGALSQDNKVIVPIKYQQISFDKNHIFANYELNKVVYPEGKTDIYSTKGILLKTINTPYIQSTNDILYMPTYTKEGYSAGGYFIDKKTYKAGEKKSFHMLRAVNNSKLFKIQAFFANEDRSIFTNFFLDKNFNIVSPDYPDTFVYNDQFLVQPLPLNVPDEDATSFAIIDFKNNKIAEYSREDYVLYQYFAHGKLDDPKFLESKKTYWKTLKKESSWKFEVWNYILEPDHFQPIHRYVKFYEIEGKQEKRTSVGYYDSDTGEMIFKRSIGDVLDISKIEGTELFQIYYTENKIRKIEIINTKNETLAKMDGEEIAAVSENFFMLKTEPEELNNRRRRNLLNMETFKKVFENNFQYLGYTMLDYRKTRNFVPILEINSKLGLIDRNLKIIRPSVYKEIFEQEYYEVIYLKKETNDLEIIRADNFKTLLKVEFEEGLLKDKYIDGKYQNEITTKDIFGTYRNGFYMFYKDKMVMDRYGNLIDQPENFEF